MKYLVLVLVLIGVALGAFYAGTVYGIGEGRKVQRWSDGLLRAETARHNLVALEKGDIDRVKGMEGVALRQGLIDHYELLNHPRRFPMPMGAYYIFAPSGKTGEPYDQIMGPRLVAYLKEHPEVGSFTTAFDPEKAVAADTDEHRAWRDQMIENGKELQRELDWVLDYYKAPAPAP